MVTNYPAAEVAWTLHTPISSTPIFPSSWNIRRSRGEPISWSISFVEADQDYTVSGPLAPFFQVDPFDEAWNLRRWLRCSITVGGVTWNSPPLVHQDFDIEVTPEGVVATASGTDQTEALLAQDEFMSEIRSVPESSFYAHGVLSQILNQYKLTDHEILFDTYGIQQLYRVGTPMDWVRSILEVRQAWFAWSGDTLVMRPGGIDVLSATPDFSLLGHQKAKLARYHRSASNCFNEATVKRVGESLAAMDEPQRDKGLGFIDVPLTRPVNFASLDVILHPPWGIADQATWFDEADNEMPGDGGFTYIGPTKVAKVRFVLSPRIGAGPFPEDVPYEAMVYGFAHNPDFGSFESSYTSNYAAAADQGVRGRRRYKRPLVNSMIPNAGVAASFAELWVREALRMQTTMAVDTVLDPGHDIGQVGAFDIHLLGLSNYKMLVESVDWNWEGSGSELTEQLELSRGAL